MANTEGKLWCYKEKEILDRTIIPFVAEDYKNGNRLVDISAKYRIPSATVIHILKQLGIFEPSFRRWTQEEVNIVSSYYPLNDKEYLVRMLPRFTWDEIVHKAYKLGVKQTTRWSDEDIMVLQIACEQGLPTKEIEQALNYKFKTYSIDCKMSNLGLLRRTPWTKEEMDIILINYEHMNLDSICDLLPGRTRDTIKTYAQKIGLVSMDWSSRMGSRAGYRNLCHFIRSNNYNWKQESIKACDGLCVVTGERFEVIHHIVGFNQIFNITLESYPDIMLRDSVQDYSIDELNYILECFLKTQSMYPPGACMTKEVHREFHMSYGFGMNTEDQYNEFIKHYNTTNPVTITA